MEKLVCPLNSFKPCSYDCMAYLGSRAVPIRKGECTLLNLYDGLNEVATELHNIGYSLDTFNSLEVSVSGDLDACIQEMG